MRYFRLLKVNKMFKPLSKNDSFRKVGKVFKSLFIEIGVFFFFRQEIQKSFIIHLIFLVKKVFKHFYSLKK